MLGSNTKASGRIGVFAAAAAMLVAAGIVASQIADQRGRIVAASPSPVASPTEVARASPSPAPTPTTGPVSGSVRRENAILGYRVDLPEGYRRSDCLSSVAMSGDFIGVDFYTRLGEREERALDTHLPPIEFASNIDIQAHRNTDGRSAVDWARSRPENADATVEPVTFDGREAARVVRPHSRPSYVVRADARMYVVASHMDGRAELPDGLIAQVAASVRAIPLQPSPAPPSQAPRDAARGLGKALADALAARDTAAVARLIEPGCWLGVSAVIPLGTGSTGCCVVNRAVVPFIEVLRERFAGGSLTVTVDPEPQLLVQGTGNARSERFFVISQWTDSGRTTRVDVFFGQRSGRWHWSGALHHYLDGEVCYGKLWGGTIQQC